MNSITEQGKCIYKPLLKSPAERLRSTPTLTGAEAARAATALKNYQTLKNGEQKNDRNTNTQEE